MSVDQQKTFPAGSLCNSLLLVLVSLHARDKVRPPWPPKDEAHNRSMRFVESKGERLLVLWESPDAGRQQF